MKITDIQVERYGVWNHLALPLQSAGLNVFYGPNEAGKTTLLRFIRDVLFGSLGESGRLDAAHLASWQGALRLSHQGRFCEVRRSYDVDALDNLEFQELDPNLAWNAEPEWAITESTDFESTTKNGSLAESALHEIVAQTPARLFRNVFAIGLNELQELATLHDEEVAEKIYGLSLGLEGKRLLAIGRQSAQRTRLTTELTELLKCEKEIQKQLAVFRGNSDRHQELLEKQAHLESEAQKHKARQASLKRELQGHEILHKVWEPWNLIREYEAELNTLPRTSVNTGIDPARLKTLESEIHDLTLKRKPILADIARVRKEIRAAAKNSAEVRHTGELQSLLNQRPWLTQTEREVELAHARSRELKTEFEARQNALGPDWPIQRLNSIDTSRAAYTHLVDAAREFQLAQARHTSLRKRYEKQAGICHQKQTECDQAVAQLSDHSLEDSIKAARQQIRQAIELTRLKNQASELERQIALRSSQASEPSSRPQVPEWVPGFLLFLATSGLFLSALGFYTSLTSNGIAGAILAMVGIAGFAIAKGFQVNADETNEAEIPVQPATDQTTQSLVEIRNTIRQSTPTQWMVALAADEIGVGPVEVRLAGKLKEHLSELKRVQKRQKKLESRRGHLSRMRKAMQNRQRQVAQSRQDWCSALKQTGLEETLPIESAFELWQKIAEAMEHLRTWEVARQNASDVQDRLDSFCEKLAQFGERTGHANLNYRQPQRVLDLWQKELAMPGDGDQELLTLKKAYRERRREANRLKQRLVAVRTARSALLAQVGATSREEFEQKLESANRRAELQELVNLAKAELATLSRSNSELAIVEDDLISYKANRTQDSIDLLKMELEDIENQLGESFESLGRIRQELSVLESDRRPANLRFEQQSLRGKIRVCLTKLAALNWAEKTAAEIRQQFEQSCQPRILEIASDYLAQLTCGKYQNIWTSLGERCLRLTDGEQNQVTVEQLSNGTREQLFLVLRLGLVSEFAERGIEVPMVLDDVLVNFDQHRTEAAIHTLIEFAERGHQVLLFTSHLHLARLCESQGIEPVWLPAHHAGIEHRRAG